GEAAANTLTVTYSDRVEPNPLTGRFDTLAVYYNGQLIENIDDNPDGKFYYSIVNTLTPPTVSLSLSTPPTDTSEIEFTVLPNPTYTASGYASGTSSYSLSPFDTLTFSYYYTIYTAV
ncbi:MAG: hypothetical protein WCO84_05960, partial [bacterium]